VSPAHVLEPTYQNLKRGLMEGLWPPGERLEALRLADEFGVSMTPVRDCLNRLVGEGMVDMKPGDGYRVPRISEKALRDMFDLNSMLLNFALLNPVAAAEAGKAEHRELDYASRVSSLFDVITSRSANTMVAEMIRSLSDRLHAIRRWEPQLLPDWVQEIEELERCLSEESADLSPKLRDYHQRRNSHVAALVQLAQS
jgi:DNA-binding GntR family transcriptional regulator